MTYKNMTLQINVNEVYTIWKIHGTTPAYCFSWPPILVCDLRTVQKVL